jgi:hypothetical protein
MGSSDDLAYCRPQHCGHNVATVPPHARHRNAKLIPLSTAIHRRSWIG